MTDRELYVCVLALFDDGWPYPRIAESLGITEQEARDFGAEMGGRGIEGLRPNRNATKDENGLVIRRNESGEIIERIPDPLG